MTASDPHRTGSDEAAAEIWSAVQAIYRAVLAGELPFVDERIDEHATIWDSEQPELFRGRAGLEKMRAQRSGGGSTVAELVPESPVIDVWGDIAVVRHVLTVSFAGSEPDSLRIRNTAVWRHTDCGWRIVHNHEDLFESTRPEATVSAHDPAAQEWPEQDGATPDDAS